MKSRTTENRVVFMHLYCLRRDRDNLKKYSIENSIAFLKTPKLFFPPVHFHPIWKIWLYVKPLEHTKPSLAASSRMKCDNIKYFTVAEFIKVIISQNQSTFIAIMTNSCAPYCPFLYNIHLLRSLHICFTLWHQIILDGHNFPGVKSLFRTYHIFNQAVH